MVSGVTTLAALAISLSIAAPAQATSAPTSQTPSVTTRALPNGSVAHRSRYWTWFGPRSWSAATGPYGITIFGPNKRMLDYGFSTTVCANGNTMSQSVNNYFSAKRSELRRSGLRNLRLNARTIKRMPAGSYGANYFRQNVTFKGKSGRKNVRGEVTFDYQLNNNVYCFVRNQSRTVPAGRNSGTFLRQLRTIQSKLAYFGPGA